MIFKILFVLIGSLLVSSTQAYQFETDKNICDQFPSLDLCQLEKGSLTLPLYEQHDEGRKDSDDKMDDVERGRRLGRQIPVKKRSEYIRFG